VGGRYSDEWHRIHFRNPRDVVPESNMPAYPYLQKAAANAGSIQAHMKALRRLGVPYTDDEIANAPKELEGKTEEDALISYLQGLGIHRRSTNPAIATTSATSIGK
jgi:cytochrome c oxidase cbb3-type subunit 2